MLPCLVVTAVGPWCVAQGTRRLVFLKAQFQDGGPSLLVIGGEGNEKDLVSSMCLGPETKDDRQVGKSG